MEDIDSYLFNEAQHRPVHGSPGGSMLGAYEILTLSESPGTDKPSFFCRAPAESVRAKHINNSFTLVHSVQTRSNAKLPSKVEGSRVKKV